MHRTITVCTLFLNLKVETPLAGPRGLAWRIYSARLCTAIKLQIRRDLGEHQSLLRPSAPKSAKGDQTG